MANPEIFTEDGKHGEYLTHLGHCGMKAPHLQLQGIHIDFIDNKWITKIRFGFQVNISAFVHTAWIDRRYEWLQNRQKSKSSE